jgi:hypothetical protein
LTNRTECVIINTERKKEVIKNESFDGFGINNVCDNGSSLGLRNCLCYKNFIRKIIKKILDKTVKMCYNNYGERERNPKPNT